MTRTLLRVVCVCALLTPGVVFAVGVTYPHPQNIPLYPGETGTFVFQIQAHDFPVRCTVQPQDTQGLELIFEPEYMVAANERYNVRAQVRAPEALPPGNYTATFCLTCAAIVDPGGGSGVTQRICGLPVTVVVLAPPFIEADVDINPKTLSLSNKGRFITCYTELPGEGDASQIDTGSVFLTVGGSQKLYTESAPTEIGDHDADGVSDLMVKFDCSAFKEMVSLGEVTVAVEGTISGGTDFKGTASVTVIK